MQSVSKKFAMSTAAWLEGRAQRLRRDESGVAAVEFALIVPIMFMLLVGAIEFSQALTVARRVTQSASSTADLIARAPSTGITQAQVDAELLIVQQLMEPYDVTPLSVKIVSVLASAVPGDPTAATYAVDWSRDNTGACPYAKNVPYTDIPAGLLTAGESVIVGEATYTYTPLIFSHFIQGALNLEEKFFLKPRNATSVTLASNPC